MPHELTTNKKKNKTSFCSVILQQQQTFSWSDCDMQWKVDFIWQPVMTSSVIRARRCSKALPKGKLAPKEKKKKGRGHCLLVCCPSEPLQLSESWWNHYTWEVCSTNRLDAPKTAMPAAGTGQQKQPNSSSWQCLTAGPTINTSNVEWIVLQSFVYSAVFTWHFAKWSPLLQASWQLFAGKMLPQPAGGRKCFPRVHGIPKHRFLGSGE